MTTQKHDVVHYALTCSIKKGSLSELDVAVRFNVPPSGRIGFGWEHEWAGESQLAQWERGLTVRGASRVTHDLPGHWLLAGRPGQTLTVSYQVTSAYDPSLTAEAVKQAPPIILPGWFKAIGHALFGLPDGSMHEAATFDWRGPATLPFNSDLLFISDRKGHRTGSGEVADILNSVVMGGREVHILTDPTIKAQFAFAGAFPVATKETPRLFFEVLKAEYLFWREAPRPFFASAMILPDEPYSRAYGGTGLGDALALKIGDKTSEGEIEQVIAHEFFHHWNPNLTGLTYLGEASDTQEEMAWVGEGFTDYYSYQLPFRAGIMSAQDWLGFWNRRLRDYARSPLRNVPNATSYKLYWSSYDGYQIPYLRGALLAVLWNRQLLKLSNGKFGLDDVMRDLRDHATTHSILIDQALIEVMRGRGADITGDVETYLNMAKPILLPTDAFGPCVEVSTAYEPIFDAGFDVKATLQQQGVVSGVEATSNAYAAGLRNGMSIALPLINQLNNPSEKWVLKAKGEHPLLISYMPQGTTVVPIQNVQFVAPLSEGCMLSASGISGNER